MKIPRFALSLILLPMISAPAVNANELASLNDDFSLDTRNNWSRRHLDEGGVEQLERWDINPADASGKMLMMPHTTTWYEQYRGPLVYRNVTGDFALTTSVTVNNRSGTGTPSSQYSLAGLMLRVQPTPVESPDNYVFLSIGHGESGSPQFEVKSTINGTSRLVLNDAQTLTTQLQIARVGDKVITLYRRPLDAEWVVHRVYDSDSADPFFDHNLGSGTLQAGFVTYTNWEKASTFTPEFQNVNTLTPAVNGQSNAPGLAFNPDLIAEFDYALFSGIELPGGFPESATPAEYLLVLGNNAIPEPGNATLAMLAGMLGCLRRAKRFSSTRSAPVINIRRS